MFLFQSPSIFPLNRYGTCIGFVWLFEQDVDEGGDVGGVDDGVAVDVAGVFVVWLFGAENHIDEHGDVGGVHFTVAIHVALYLGQFFNLEESFPICVGSVCIFAAFGHINLSTIVIESIFLYRGRGGGQALQRLNIATIERPLTYHFHATADSDRFQSITAFESTLVYLLVTIWNHDFGQAVAFREGVFKDCL